MNGLTAGDSRKLNYHKTAIFFSAVTLIVTVSSMLLAKHPAIKSVGFSTLVGLLAAVILSYVLQPAIFRWLNRKKS
jgi:predicted RND superfamily exporter protein